MELEHATSKFTTILNGGLFLFCIVNNDYAVCLHWSSREEFFCTRHKQKKQGEKKIRMKI
jgi:hypothetical protein